MLICNGLVGLCLVVGGVRHYEQGFQALGASAALAVLAALVTLTLVLPNFTTSAPGPLYTPPQLIFAGVVSLVLYGAFVFVQTVRHRGYFLTVFEEDEVHEAPPSGPVALLSFAATRFAGGSGCAGESTDPTVEAGIDRFGAPKAVVGVIIATLGAIARKSGGAASGSPQPPANEYEPGAGFNAREHRPDDTHGGICIDCNNSAACTRAWRTGGSAAVDHSACLGPYIGNRADDGAARRRAPGHFGDVSVLHRGPLVDQEDPLGGPMAGCGERLM